MKHIHCGTSKCCGECINTELDESVEEDTTTASVAFPPTMMPKKLLRRRKEPKVQEIIMVDRRYKEESRGVPILRKSFRKYIEDPT
jgi:hypothetical protein